MKTELRDILDPVTNKRVLDYWPADLVKNEVFLKIENPSAEVRKKLHEPMATYFKPNGGTALQWRLTHKQWIKTKKELAHLWQNQ